MSRRTELEILRTAAWHFTYALRYSKGDVFSDIVIDAISMRLFAGLDALWQLQESVRCEMFGESAHQMRGMRNRIAHGYGTVDAEIIRDTIAVDVPALLSTINARMQAIESATPD